MKTSKVTTKYQATVPKEIREFLAIHAGDGLRWEIEDSKVVVHKLTKLDLEWQKSIEMTLSEWSSPEDEEAYGSL
jgi:AbrB family looped-hinge helix DNA binding protein